MAQEIIAHIGGVYTQPVSACPCVSKGREQRASENLACGVLPDLSHGRQGLAKSSCFNHHSGR